MLVSQDGLGKDKDAVSDLNTVVRLIAQRGGFLARKGDGEPRDQDDLAGLQDIAIFAEGVRFAPQAAAMT